MANTIKIGNIEASSIKIGTSTVSAVYIGSTKIYPSTPPTPVTRQWVSYTAGTSINDITDNVYGIRIALDNLIELFGGGAILYIEFKDFGDIEFKDFVIVINHENSLAYIRDETDETPIEYDFESDFEVIFSDYGFNGDYDILAMLLDGSQDQDGILLCDMELYM